MIEVKHFHSVQGHENQCVKVLQSSSRIDLE